jgi:preprotein translocase subunit SecB
MTEDTATPPKFDEKKQPGITFLGVNLMSLEFDAGPEVPDKLRYGPTFDTNRDFSSDGTLLTYTMRVDLFGAMPEDQKPRIKFKAELVGRFEYVAGGNMSLQEYAEHNAPGLMVPYLRELVANVTTRSPLPTLNMSPINVSAFMKGTDTKLHANTSKKAVQND